MHPGWEICLNITLFRGCLRCWLDGDKQLTPEKALFKMPVLINENDNLANLNAASVTQSSEKDHHDEDKL